MPETQVDLHMGFEISWVAYGASMFQSKSPDSTTTTKKKGKKTPVQQQPVLNAILMCTPEMILRHFTCK